MVFDVGRFVCFAYHQLFLTMERHEKISHIWGVNIISY
jgi:hypothetical protein